MFNTIFYEPLYNLLVVVLQVVPLHDIGAAIIVVTIIIRVLLLPINISAMRSQYAMKRVEGEMKALREEYAKDAKAASQKMMELYKRENIKPFSSILGILIQMPILFALFFVFKNGLVANPEHLYSFVSFPEILHTKAFGLIDVTKVSIVFAFLATVTSYLLAKRQTATMISNKPAHEETMQDQFMKSMRIQLLYVLPLLVGGSAIFLPAALPLYWTVGNLASIAQDIYIKHTLSTSAV